MFNRDIFSAQALEHLHSSSFSKHKLTIRNRKTGGNTTINEGSLKNNRTVNSDSRRWCRLDFWIRDILICIWIGGAGKHCIQEQIRSKMSLEKKL